MNIAVLHFHRLGGSGIIAYELARAMQKKGHQVHFVGLNPPFRMNQDDNLLGFHFHRVTFEPYPVFDFQPYSFALASQLSEIILDNDIDVIHSHYAIPFAMVALMAREISGKKNLKCITTLHGTDITVVGSHPSMLRITKHSIEKSDYVTCVSNYLKNKTTELFKIAEDKVKMIYNFIDMADMPEDLSFKKSIDEKDEIVILHSSNLREVKAPLDVISIFHQLIESVLPVIRKKLRLSILGEGPLKSSMQQMVRTYGLCDHVTFWGERSDIGSFLESSDLFLLPSLEESFGLAALEAMSWGVPVVAREVGGLPELITHGEDGYLFPPDNLSHAVDKIKLLLTDPEKLMLMSDKAYQTVKERFVLEKIIPKFEKLYLN